MPELDIIMRQLGYTENWLRLGVVDSNFLKHQYVEFLRSDDKNQEHYRHRAFLRFLDRREELPEGEIEAIFGLTDEGPDGCDLRQTRILELLDSEVLSDDQLSGLTRFPEVLESEAIRKKHRRCLLTRRLTAEGPTDEVFEAMRRSGDSILHLALLHRSDLRRQQVEWLAENGGNKSVRNQASQMLESRRFRKEKGRD